MKIDDLSYEFRRLPIYGVLVVHLIFELFRK